MECVGAKPAPRPAGDWHASLPRRPGAEEGKPLPCASRTPFHRPHPGPQASDASATAQADQGGGNDGRDAGDTRRRGGGRDRGAGFWKQSGRDRGGGRLRQGDAEVEGADERPSRRRRGTKTQGYKDAEMKEAEGERQGFRKSWRPGEAFKSWITKRERQGATERLECEGKRSPGENRRERLKRAGWLGSVGGRHPPCPSSLAPPASSSPSSVACPSGGSRGSQKEPSPTHSQPPLLPESLPTPHPALPPQLP